MESSFVFFLLRLAKQSHKLHKLDVTVSQVSLVGRRCFGCHVKFMYDTNSQCAHMYNTKSAKMSSMHSFRLRLEVLFHGNQRSTQSANQELSEPKCKPLVWLSNSLVGTNSPPPQKDGC